MSNRELHRNIPVVIIVTDADLERVLQKMAPTHVADTMRAIAPANDGRKKAAVPISAKWDGLLDY